MESSVSDIGFKARISVNDGASDAEQFFSDVCTIKLGDREVGEYEEKVLHTSTKARVFKPTLIDLGTVVVKGYWTKADYVRLIALLGVETKTWKIYEPVASGTAPLLATMTNTDCWLKKISDTTFEKDVPKEITFELRVNAVTIAA